MSIDPNAFFAGSGGGSYAPGWWTGQVGNEIAGTIVEPPEVMDQTDMKTGQPIAEQRNGQPVIDPATGQPRIKKQVRVILQTALRNWQGLKSQPVDSETGQPRPPHEDDGRRAVYVKGWMTGAVGDAVKAATGEIGAPKVGGKLAVKVTELVQSQVRGNNPYPKFVAQYQAPNPADATFQQHDANQQGQAPQQAWGQPPAQQGQAPQQQAPQQAPQQAWGQPPVQQAQAPQQQAPQQAEAPNPWSAPPAANEQGSPWAAQGFGDTPTF